MSHFQHEHILRLLAICTDHDPFFLILELMEGGDLLSYLRTSRGVSYRGSRDTGTGYELAGVEGTDTRV